jgi:diguanylate cyclase (GGDEF)-like protein
MRRYEQPLPDGSLVAIRVDVTEAENQRRALDEAQHALERARQRLEDAIEALPAGFEMYDASDRLVMVNSTNLEMYPLLSDLADQRPTFEEIVRANAARGGLPMIAAGDTLDAWIEQRRTERRQVSAMRVHRIAEGRWVRVHERRMRDGGLVAIRLDVSELMQRESELLALSRKLERMNKDLAALSHSDPLTGLANRRAFDFRLNEEVSQALKHGTSLALLLVDVDHFKAFNDHYGHPSGDECLRRVAQLLRDTAARPTDLVVRLGGEEFALLLPNQDGRSAAAFAQQCVRAVESAAIAHAGSATAPVVTISIGVADLAGCDTPTPAALMAAADAALYRAKQRGRNRAVRELDAAL